MQKTITALLGVLLATGLAAYGQSGALVLGQTASARDWASLIDHTLLRPDATERDIKILCEEAAQYHFASVCVNPTWVRASACHLQGTGVPVCTVIGFPLGATLSDVKAYEARRSINSY